MGKRVFYIRHLTLYFGQAALDPLLVTPSGEVIMADAGDRMSRHHLETLIGQPIDGVPRVINGESG